MPLLGLTGQLIGVVPFLVRISEWPKLNPA
jgi:hypothetical protein